MNILNLILPVFLIIITGWICNYFKVFDKNLAHSLIQFALYIAMPALLFVTIAAEPFDNIFNWKFIAAFGGGSLIAFLFVFLINYFYMKKTLSKSTLSSLNASMTNTGFVALPLMLAIFGTKGVLPAAIATVFVVVIMFPLGVFLLEIDRNKASDSLFKSLLLASKQTLMNPMVLSTVLGIIYAATGLSLPTIIKNYLNIFAAALTPCALFAIGLGTNIKTLSMHVKEVGFLTIVKLIILPMIVFGLCQLFHLDPFFSIAAILAAAVPTAKTTYVLASQYKIMEESTAAVISATTIFSIITLFILLLLLSYQWPTEFKHSGTLIIQDSGHTIQSNYYRG